MNRVVSILVGSALAALVATVTLPEQAHAQGLTRTLDDLRAEYRAQCGKGGSRERLIVAYDRAIRIARGPATRKQLTAQRAAVANPREPVCPEPRPLATQPARPLPVAGGDGAVEDVCDRPAPNPRIAECKRFRLILGRWTSRRGGVIETVLTPNGTIAATIVTSSEWMRDNGYNSGMQVLRGWQPRIGTANWVVFGVDGEGFAFGKWNKAGVIAINRATPNLLGIPIEGAICNYCTFERVGAVGQ